MNNSIQDANKDAELYLNSLTDHYFENTPKNVLVKNAYLMGKFSKIENGEKILKEITELRKENLNLKIENLKSVKSQVLCYESSSGYGDDYAGDADKIQKKIDALEKELKSISE